MRRQHCAEREQQPPLGVEKRAEVVEQVVDGRGARAPLRGQGGVHGSRASAPPPAVLGARGAAGRHARTTSSLYIILLLARSCLTVLLAFSVDCSSIPKRCIGESARKRNRQAHAAASHLRAAEPSESARHMLPSTMSLVLVIAPTCRLAPRSSVRRPATLAAHMPGMTSGTHACTQQLQHLDSNQYHDATSGACPESGLPSVHVGRSTRGLVGRTPLVLRPSTYGSTSGRGLTSCCLRAGDTMGYNGAVLSPLPQRPAGARFFCCPVPMQAHSSSACRPVVSRAQSLHAFLCSGCCSVFLRLRPTPSLVHGLVCGAGALTTATLSVGEFQWEYKETVAGVITKCYMQGPAEELDICLEDRQLELVTGTKKIRVGGNSQLSERKRRTGCSFNRSLLCSPCRGVCLCECDSLSLPVTH